MSLDALEWRRVLAEEQPHAGRYAFADWVKELSDRSGVYLIRSDPDQFNDDILYVGESHTVDEPEARPRRFRGLYRTLTRHFHIGNHWTRGLTYDPEHVLVAVELVSPDRAIDYQDELIAYYKPRDNDLVKEMWGYSADDDDHEQDDAVPF